jgi:hypothetical protein
VDTTDGKQAFADIIDQRDELPISRSQIPQLGLFHRAACG